MIDCARAPGSTIINKESGILASMQSTDSGCGSTASPWLIEAAAGQRINLTMLDFGSSGSYNQGRTASCIQYGFISERRLGVNKTICGGNGRQQAIYTSATSSVEIALTPTGQEPAYFLIQFQGRRINTLKNRIFNFINMLKIKVYSS